MNRLPLSVAIVTLNEEANLPRLLASIEGLASEIVVVDSGSTDGTERIAKAAGARWETAKWEGFIAQKNRSLDFCTQPWVLFLDADEALSPELADAMQKLFATGDPAADGYDLNRRTWYLGDWIWHAWYPEWRLRLLRRGAGRWDGMDPHASLAVKGRTQRLDGGDLLHYSFRDLEDHLRRTISYSKTMAASYAANGKRFRWRYLLLSPQVAIFKHLVLKQGWRDGWRGWLVSIIRGIDVFAKYAFLLEKERGK